MSTFEQISAPVDRELLISFYDIEGFARQIARATDGIGLFSLMSGMATTTVRAIAPTPGHVVKFMGDSAIIIFPKGSADVGVRTLIDLKRELTSYFRGEGYEVGMRFTVHYGTATLGRLLPDGPIDVYGHSVNTAALLGRGDHASRFIISPQAFRTLEPATRKRFHKYTPPVVYLAEEQR